MEEKFAKKSRITVGVLLVTVLVLLTRPGIPPAQAEVVTNTNLAFSMTIFVPCANGGAGEDVALSGEIHYVVAVTTDESGQVHMVTHAQPVGVIGVGLTTGDKYRGTGASQEVENDAPGLPWEGSLISTFKVVGKGRGNNFTVHSNVHMRINADGTVTAAHDNTSFDCR